MEALWIMLIPLIWLFTAKYLFRRSFNWKELGVSMLIVAALTFGTIEAGKYGKTMDYEVWNGQVISKTRDNSQYEESYDCNCRSTKNGESCDTCYRTHYTVDWTAKTTVGGVEFDSEDSLSSSVWDDPDPAPYVACHKGEPASIEHEFTNYVKAVPESLFHDNDTNLLYLNQVPAYPQVFNFYHINRVINMAGIDNGTVQAINSGLNNALRTLGWQKQVNIIVILTPINDPSYKYSVERKWLGGKKNDVIIYLGINKNKQILWADTSTWAMNSGNELFQITMRDGLTKMGNAGPLDANKFVTYVTGTISKLFDRPQMKSYEYLKDEISPPTWVVILAIILAFGSSIGCTIVFNKYEL